jgi:hypothetical protein
MAIDSRTDLLKQLQAEVAELARPIDFDELESKGVLTKEGAWYRIHKFKELPKHAGAKVTELAQDARGVKVKFSRASRFEKLAAKFSKVG